MMIQASIQNLPATPPKLSEVIVSTRGSPSGQRVQTKVAVDVALT